jgi:hypothetical protein
MINITHLRIKPLALTNGHGRYITVTAERTPASVGEYPLNRYIAVKCLSVPFPKPPCNGRFASETADRRFQNWNRHLDPEVVLKIRWGFQEALDATVFQGGDDGRGYRNMCKIPRGSNLTT